MLVTLTWSGHLYWEKLHVENTIAQEILKPTGLLCETFLKSYSTVLNEQSPRFSIKTNMLLSVYMMLCSAHNTTESINTVHCTPNTQDNRKSTHKSFRRRLSASSVKTSWWCCTGRCARRWWRGPPPPPSSACLPSLSSWRKILWVDFLLSWVLGVQRTVLFQNQDRWVYIVRIYKYHMFQRGRHDRPTARMQ